jgi:cyclopropane fatty-acyl-phospholipid synthase-like methyltransferase
MFRKLFFNIQYLKHPPWDTGISPPELIHFMDGHQPGRALDLGCGTGTNAIALARRGWQVTGVDFARGALRTARSKAKNAGLQIDFQIADVSRLPGISGPFDLILDIGCFHSLPSNAKKRYLVNLDNLLSASGSYMLYAFLCPPGQQGTGVLQTDLDALMSQFQMVFRQDGTERGLRASAWFIFERK